MVDRLEVEGMYHPCVAVHDKSVGMLRFGLTYPECC